MMNPQAAEETQNKCFVEEEKRGCKKTQGQLCEGWWKRSSSA